MEQLRALNALEPFLALSKSAAAPRAAADLVTQATSAPNTYVFAELLQTPNIQALRKSEDYAKYLTLLEIFAWGTWEDYKSHSSLLPALSPQQQQKLRLLSLLSIASTTTNSAPTHLRYPNLQQTLSLPSVRALEDLLITATSSSLITATLNPAKDLVAITSVAPLRDLVPGSVPGLSSALEEWVSRCEGVLVDLDSEVAQVRAQAKEKAMKKARMERAVEEATKEKEESKTRGKRGFAGNGSGGAVESEEMDVDTENTGGGLRNFFGMGRNAAKRGGGFSGGGRRG